MKAIRRIDGFAWLAAPALVYLALLYAIPLGLLLFKSLNTAETFPSFAGYIEFFGDEYHLNILWRTVRVALLVTGLSLLLAYPTAFVLARAKGVVQSLILIAMVLPLAVGVIVKTFAWSVLFRSDGLLNKLIMGLGMTEEPVRMLFTETALAATGSSTGGSSYHLGCNTTPWVFACSPPIDAAWRGRRRCLRILNGCIDVCHPKSHRRRAQPNHGHVDSPFILIFT
jgi:ABC-type Fe3+ transport system permease subunit